MYTYWVKLESFQTLSKVGRRSKLFGVGNVKSFFDENKTKNSQETTHNCLDVKDITPTKILINVTTNNWSNSRTENSTI